MAEPDDAVNKNYNASGDRKVENASRVVKKLANSVSSAQSIVFHGARIALVGHVTKTLSSIVQAEEEERRSILLLFQQTPASGGADNRLADGSLSSSVLHMSDELRIGLNGTEVNEHEERYELVHLESSIHKELLAAFVRRWLQLTEGVRHEQRIARALLEREATMRIVQLAAHYETQCKALDALMHAEYTRVHLVSTSRTNLRLMESEHRETILSHEVLKTKQIFREAASSSNQLRRVQQQYEQEMKELRRLEAEAQELKSREDAEAAAEDRRARLMAEVEDEEFLKRRKVFQDETFLWSDLLKAEAVKRSLVNC